MNTNVQLRVMVMGRRWERGNTAVERNGNEDLGGRIILGRVGGGDFARNRRLIEGEEDRAKEGC